MKGNDVSLSLSLRYLALVARSASEGAKDRSEGAQEDAERSEKLSGTFLVPSKKLKKFFFLMAKNVWRVLLNCRTALGSFLVAFALTCSELLGRRKSTRFCFKSNDRQENNRERSAGNSPGENAEH